MKDRLFDGLRTSWLEAAKGCDQRLCVRNDSCYLWKGLLLDTQMIFCTGSLVLKDMEAQQVAAAYELFQLREILALNIIQQL